MNAGRGAENVVWREGKHGGPYIFARLTLTAAIAQHWNWANWALASQFVGYDGLASLLAVHDLLTKRRHCRD